VKILIDADSFYCEVERLFNPRLLGRPVVVLSNNDGNVVSRTREANALGVQMGQPYHELRKLFPGGAVIALSSNHALYFDMSQRMQRTIGELAPCVEHYSIDESFVETEFDAVALGRDIRRRIRDHLGLPVSIGIAPTKVLAKVAMENAKRSTDRLSAFPKSAHEGDQLLANLPVDEVWGVADGLAARLRPLGVLTALDLKLMNPAAARAILGIVGHRLVLELQGISCLPIEDAKPSRQSILRSRSFGHPVESLDELLEAVSTHASRAAEKLREEAMVASRVGVFVGTNPFSASTPQYFNSCESTLDTASSFTPRILAAATACLRRVYRKGFSYKRAGVMLADLSPANAVQLHFNSPPLAVDRRRERLMAAVDQVNRRWGRETLRLASTGFTKSWQMRQKNKSPAYTTRWTDLLVLRA
jgi:DNA polymerase V